MHVFSHVAESSSDDDGGNTSPSPPPNDGVLNINKHVDRAAEDALTVRGLWKKPLDALAYCDGNIRAISPDE